MTAAFFFGQYVNLTLEFRMRDGFVPVWTEPDRVRFRFFQYHGAGHRCCHRLQPDPRSYGTFPRPVATVCFFSSFRPTISNGVADFDDATFNTARCNRTTAGDGEDVFDRHQERFRESCPGVDVFVNSIHQFEDAGFLFRVAFQGFPIAEPTTIGISSPG